MGEILPVATILLLESWNLETSLPKKQPRMGGVSQEREVAFGTSLYLFPPTEEQLSSQICTHCLPLFSPSLTME